MKLLVCLSLILAAITVQAQSYKLNASMGAYTDLSGATSLNDGQVWDDPDFKVPIGFSFDLFGTTMTDIYIDDFGLGAYLTHTTVDTGIKPLIIAYGADIIDRGYDIDHTASEISYLTEGSAGSRILKIEWKNFGFWGDLDDDGVASDSGNMQVWLYETSNAIEIRFGPNQITSQEINYEGLPGPFIGIIGGFDFDAFDVDSAAHFVTGNPNMPTLSYADTIAFVDGDIPNGAIYRFYIPNAGVNGLENADISIFPNPANTRISISSNKRIIQSVALFNVSGQEVIQPLQATNGIDVSQLSRGVYVANIKTDIGMIRQKVILK